MNWRKENEVGLILDWEPPSHFSEDYPYEITGVDKDGCPVLVVPFGHWDVRKVCEQGRKSDYIRYVDQLFFRVVRAMRSNSPAQSKFIMVMVPDNLSPLRQMSSTQAVEAVLETVRRFEANHPETLKRAFVVDTPKVFQLIFGLIRPMINSKTLGKVTIAGGSREWRPALLKLIDPENLPLRLRGTFSSKFPVIAIYNVLHRMAVIEA